MMKTRIRVWFSDYEAANKLIIKYIEKCTYERDGNAIIIDTNVYEWLKAFAIASPLVDSEERIRNYFGNYTNGFARLL